jgi:general secretion pathway protein N
LLNARGSFWQGQADLLLTGGAGSQTRAALPQGIRWQLRPGWDSGSPAMRLAMEAPCCTPEPMHLSLRPGVAGGSVSLAASRSQWPADLLTGLGTPWNTLRLEGRLQLETQGFTARWHQGRLGLEGALGLDAFDVASRLSTLRPLGSYRLELQAAGDGHTATLALSTHTGALQLQGQGSGWARACGSKVWPKRPAVARPRWPTCSTSLAGGMAPARCSAWGNDMERMHLPTAPARDRIDT